MTSVERFPFIAAVACGVVCLVTLSSDPENLRAIWILRPLTMLLLVAHAAVIRDALARTYRRLIVIGLLATLAADVMQMLPGEQLLAGLVAVGSAQLLLLVAVGTRTPLFRARPAVIAFAVVATATLTLLLPAVGGPLRLAVIAVVLGGGAMAAQAASWMIAAPASPSARLAAIGTAMLLSSHTLLLLDSLITVVPAYDLLMLGTLWLGVGALATSVRRPPPPTLRL